MLRLLLSHLLLYCCLVCTTHADQETYANGDGTTSNSSLTETEMQQESYVNKSSRMDALANEASEAMSSRLVLTFSEYNVCDAWHSERMTGSSSRIHCANMVKCYGRRLILDMTGCNSSGWDVGSTLRQVFPSCVLVEEDTTILAVDLTVDELQGSSDFAQGETGEEYNASSAADAFVSDHHSGGHGWKGLWNLRMLRIEEMWEALQNSSKGPGEGQLIALLDSGIEHGAKSMFAGFVADGGYDFVSDPSISLDGDGRDADATDPGDAGTQQSVGQGLSCSTPSWHGTFVASVAAHYTAEQFTGISPGAGILPIRVLGMCKTGYASDVSDAITWAVGGTINGIESNSVQHRSRIIVMPFAGRGRCPSYLQSAVDLAINQYNATLLASAGNKGDNASNYFPGNCAGVLSVGALDLEWMPTSYSAVRASVYMPGGTWEWPVPCMGPPVQLPGRYCIPQCHQIHTNMIEHVDLLHLQKWMCLIYIYVCVSPYIAGLQD